MQILEDAKIIYSAEALKEFQKPIEFKIVKNQIAAASARHDANVLGVDINSGLLESPRLTPDSLRMIICHELGHLFGGAPRKNIPPEWEGPIGPDGLSYMSSEGQADYYASTSCFKRMLDLERPFKKMEKSDLKRIGPVLEGKCKMTAGFKGQELETCYRSALAGLDFLRLAFDFPISCEEQDTNVSETLIRDTYPDRQCRLDTIINGTLCSEKTPLSMDPSETEKNTCAAEYAKRPKCWFP